MTITVFNVFVRMSSYCICCLYPHGLHSLLDLEIKLSIYENTRVPPPPPWELTPEDMFSRGAGLLNIKPLYSHVLVIRRV